MPTRMTGRGLILHDSSSKTGIASTTRESKYLTNGFLPNHASEQLRLLVRAA